MERDAFRWRPREADHPGWWGRVQGLAAHGPRGAGCGWRKRQLRLGPGLQGPDKDACQKEGRGRKDVYKSPGEKAREAAPGPREQWVLDFSGSLMRQLMERVTEASPGRPESG